MNYLFALICKRCSVLYLVSTWLLLTGTASAEIQRSEFGMHGMKIFISDTVSFNLKIEATRVGI